MDEQVILRPDWWRPGMPLPALQPSTTYTGSGKLRSGGRVFEQASIHRWESLSEWEARATTPTIEQEI